MPFIICTTYGILENMSRESTERLVQGWTIVIAYFMVFGVSD